MKKRISTLVASALTLMVAAQPDTAERITIQDTPDSIRVTTSEGTRAVSHASMAKMYLQRGSGHGANGEVQKAIEQFNTALLYELDNADIYYNRGLSYFNLKDYHKALADFDKALSHTPSDTNALSQRGVTKSMLRDFGNQS